MRRDCVCRKKTVPRYQIPWYRKFCEEIARQMTHNEWTGRSPLSNAVCKQMPKKQHVSAYVTPVCESSKCTTQKEQVRELSSFPREPDGDLGLYNAFECRTGKGQPGRSAFKLVDCWRNARLDGHVQQMANLARRRLLGSQENRKVSEEPEIGRRGVTTALQLSCPSRTSSCPRGTRARCTGVAVCDF